MSPAGGLCDLVLVKLANCMITISFACFSGERCQTGRLAHLGPKRILIVSWVGYVNVSEFNGLGILKLDKSEKEI